ncbi:MAG: phosphoglycolate phosphatase [Candidatus Binatia bacterium]|nr:MAG: phosphoglycolate phosphatase [Candidatus Binatia bacterium]
MIHGIDVERVRASVFDLGGVLFEGGPATVVEFGLRCGLEPERWRELRRELFSDEGPWARVERGEMALEDFARLLKDTVEKAGGSVDLDRARRFMGDDGNGEGRIRREILEAIGRIRRRMPTALLTNNVAEWRESWRRTLPLDDLFDVVVDSSECGFRKPEPRIYELTRARLGVPHDGIFFVDDLGVNLKSARALGWQTLKYEDTARVLEVLEALGRGPSLRA